MTFPAEQDRLRGDVAREGVVTHVDHAARRCRVKIAEGFETQPIPWFAFAAGQLAAWRPPSIGEQGLVIAPDAELGRAVFLPGIYSDAMPPPSTAEDLVVLTYGDMRLVMREDALAITNDAREGGIVFASDHISLRWKRGDVDKFVSVDGSADYGVIHSVDTVWPDVHQAFDHEVMAL